MERFYVVKCDTEALKKLLLKALGKHKFVSFILFKNTFRDVVLEQVADLEMKDIYDGMVEQKSFVPGPNNTCNND